MPPSTHLPPPPTTTLGEDTMGATINSLTTTTHHNSWLRYYGCHRGSTQQWKVTVDGRIQVASGADACLAVKPTLAQWHCAASDPEQIWRRRGNSLRPEVAPDLCLTSDAAGGAPRLETCTEGSPSQQWEVCFLCQCTFPLNEQALISPQRVHQSTDASS